jgi:DNA-binding GntR family transcriptional regulator
VRAAATRFSDSDASTARDALAEHVRLSKLGDNIASRQAHTEFHFAIYRAGGSRWLPRAIEPVWQNSERYRFGSRQTKARIEQTRREHQAILDACVAHDESGAEAALREHLEGAMQRITETMERRSAHSSGKP